MKFFFFFLFLLGCGYKPSSVYQNKIIGENVDARVEIDVKNPRESIYLKDALRDVLFSLHKKVVSENSDTIIKINSSSSNIEVLDFDENGFPYLYRSNVSLKISVIDKNKIKRNYNVSGHYDFSISNNSILTDYAKLEAKKRATINALDKFFALLAKDK